MLELLYYKCNPAIKIIVDGTIFLKKKIKTITCEIKTRKDIIFAWVLQ